ncbi:MAG: TonB-dependent receptor [Acidobacteriota bacterium]
MTMRMTIAALVLLWLASCCVLDAQGKQTGVIRGRVTDASTGASVPFQTVRISGTAFGTSTDADGWFTLRNIPPGRYELLISGVGYAPAVMPVVLQAQAEADTLSLRIRPEDVALAQVEIAVEAEAKTADTPVSIRTLSPHDLRMIAGGMDDPARTLALMPGVAPMRVERHDLVVRGGAPFENLFIVDHIEFPTISHYAVQGAGTGMASMVNTDFIDRVSFSSGGFGVKRGDRLSSVVGLSLREGSRDTGSASLTLSATQFGLSAEGPLLHSGSFLAGVRRSYLEPVFKAYDMSFAPVYWDACLKAGIRLGASDEVHVLAIGAADRMRLFNETQSKRNSNADLVFGDQDMLTAGVTWEHYSSAFYLLVAASNSTGSYAYYQPEDGARRRSTIDSYENEASLSADVSLSLAPSVDLSFGARSRIVRIRDHVFLAEAPWFLNVNGSLSSIEKRADTSGMKHAAYVQLSKRLGGVTVTAGVRADRFTLIDEGTVVSPRASAIWQISSEWEATASLGRYRQAPAGSWFVNPYNRHLLHAGADHAVIGLTRYIGGEWKVALEAYRKSYFNYPVSIEAPCMTVFNSGSPGTNFKDFGLDSLTSRGRGAARGIEFSIQKKFSDSPVSGMFAVSLSETEFTSLDGVTRPADHDQRWIVNTVVDYRAGESWEFTGRFRLYTGHPYTDRFILNYGTLEQFAREYNALRVGINHSLDVRLSHRWQTQAAQIEVFLDIQNVYNKKPLDTPEMDLRTGTYKETAMVGIVPSLGIRLSL